MLAKADEKHSNRISSTYYLRTCRHSDDKDVRGEHIQGQLEKESEPRSCFQVANSKALPNRKEDQ